MPKSLHSREARAELLQRLDRLRGDSSAAWGRMNVGQMVCHLSDSMRMSLGQLPTKTSGKRIFQTLPMRTLAIYVVPWPKGAPTAPELLSTPPAQLDADRAKLRSLIEDFGQAALERWPSHPLFGPLNRREWGHLCYRHIDHHLRQFSA
jgi:hypothetical protein